ncbi:heme A synthase [bacterium]|nr:heme A synthase [bacterium]
MASPADTFRRFRPLPVGIVVLTYCLILLGAITRLMGAGLSCPDWPLCNGKLIPTFEGGVIYEWLHRLVAGTVSMLFMGMLVWIFVNPTLRKRLWKLALLAVAVLGVQITLGALTVTKLLKPLVVTMHLGTGTLLFSTLICIAGATVLAAKDAPAAPRQPKGLKPLALLTLVGVYGQILLGGLVASNYASWACPDFPTCHGMWFPPLTGFIGLHMIHRYGAYAVTLIALALFVVGRKAEGPRMRLGISVVFALVCAQIALGIANVLMKIPVPLAAAHNGLAEAILATLVALNFALWHRGAAAASDTASAREEALKA